MLLHLDASQPADLAVHAGAYALTFGSMGSMLWAWLKSKGGAL